MRDGSTNWLDDTADEDARPSRRTGLLLALASVPWLVVVALLVLPGRISGGSDASSPTPGAGIPPADADAPSADTDPAPEPGGVGDTAEDGGGIPPAAEPPQSPDPEAADDGATSGPMLGLTEQRGRWRVEPGPEEAAALAIVIARAWLTGMGPQLPVDGVPVDDEGRYAEHLVVEAVEQPAPEAAVVTLLAVVLEGEDDLRAQVRRLAVPLAWEQGGPRPAGSPWWLPAPSLDPLVPAAEPIEDPDEHLAALEALTAAGLEDVELQQLGRTTGWPVIAEVTATTASGERIAGAVWLRRHLDGFVVAGTTATGTAAGGVMEPSP